MPLPRLPSQLTYNDLNGQEAIEVLTDWFRQLLQSQPYLQPHLTLPMADITLDIGIQVDMYPGGTVPIASPPEQLTIAGAVKLENKLSTRINAAPIPGGVPPDKVREQHDLPIPRPGYGPRETGSHLFLADIAAETERKRTDNPTGGREGIVADGYVFSSEPTGSAVSVQQPGVLEQTIPIDRGEIEIDMTGRGKMHQGDMVVTAGSHIASKKSQGDQAGQKYGSVAATYDLGPAGLAQPGRGGGLYRDGRTKISFGNDRRG
jgi:hypothetical protein